MKEWRAEGEQRTQWCSGRGTAGRGEQNLVLVNLSTLIKGWVRRQHGNNCRRWVHTMVWVWKGWLEWPEQTALGGAGALGRTRSTPQRHAAPRLTGIGAPHLPPFFLLLSFFLLSAALASPLLTAPTASLKPCLRAHLPTGAAALSASVPTSTVTLAAVVTVVLAALPARIMPGAGTVWLVGELAVPRQ